MLQRLLGDGCDVTFAPAEGHDAGRYDCFIIKPGGDTIVGSGATPSEALAKASAPAEADGTDLAAVTADELGEHPGDVEAAAGSLPWTMAADGAAWTATLPDGRSALIERLDDGVSFLPWVDENTGPVCAGLLGAAAWCAQFAAVAK